MTAQRRSLVLGAALSAGASLLLLTTIAFAIGDFGRLGSSGGGGSSSPSPPPSCTNTLDFSVACNSQYAPLIAGGFR